MTLTHNGRALTARRYDWTDTLGRVFGGIAVKGRRHG